jgi:hypothetical protein
MVWACKENARKQTATENFEWEPEGKRRKRRPKERWMDEVRRSMTAEEDTRDRNTGRNLVLGEGNPL